MITERIKLGRTEALPAWNVKAIRRYFHRHSHAPKVFSHRCNSVGFFDAKFGCVPNRETFLTCCAEDGQNRDLVDQRGRKLLLDYASANSAALHFEVPDQFPAHLLDIGNANVRAGADEKVN